MPNDFHAGQRWISTSEPELGLGSILHVTDRTVLAVFKASGEKRHYSRNNAPLQRVRFRPGDAVQGHRGKALVVESVDERDGLLFYCTAGKEICETELSETIVFNKPEERLLAGHLDPPSVFDLRRRALEHQHHRRKSSVRGFVGGRIDLIPHQLYIASEVAGRLVPRVLLADEVGLGKTIEASLILHRLILTGRAQRVLILVPESLVHQWFVELLRRFNLWFHIYDEERCRAIETVNAGENPFLDDQLILADIALLTSDERRLKQALAAEWDILVVDEAHHLRWSPEEVSPEYAAVEALGSKTPGLLLLTATPEQLGIAGHFARLRLLDPDRFYDLAEFIGETKQYRDVAREAEQVGDSPRLDALLDQHGTGRVSFRNTRTTISGFPHRVARLERLESPPGTPSARNDPRMDWLVDLLRSLDPQKVLLICRTQARVALIETALRQRIKNVKLGIFHEGLSLIQRDRNAAWFGDENGARILICSEIGSEGRNFQFAHHLVLYDLPLDPELLEQRIGRLDRIGQHSEIHVYVPFAGAAADEVWARWYHEGLNAFEKNLHAGRELLERFRGRVNSLAQEFDESGLGRLIEESRAASQELTARLHEGRDRLLEMNSFRPRIAARIVDEIRREDQDETLDEFMLQVFDQYSIDIEELAPRTYRLGSAGVFTDSFPGLPAEGFTVTSDRKRALAREDVQFLTWDHPLVSGALDFLLGSEKGNSSFALWPDAKTAALYVETIYVIECIAPSHLHVDRFLPPTPLRVVLDQRGHDVGSSIASETLSGQLTEGDAEALLERPALREEMFPRWLEKAGEIAAGRMEEITAGARRQMTSQLEQEIARLKELQKVNRSIRPEEIELLENQRQALDEHLSGARLRLDAIRLIQRGE